MPYSVKELFYTLQGEGAHSGRPAIFCRFTGCNLWSGQEKDRAKALCKFCDTDFVGTDGPGGGVFRSAEELADVAAKQWPVNAGHRFVVFTGGEPLLQLDERLISAFKSKGFAVAVETNGTVAAPSGLDWLCMSPKANTEIVIKQGHELKVVFPQEGLDPQFFEGLRFDHFFLQPMDGINKRLNTEMAVRYCLDHPRWRLSVQMHKTVGIP